LLLFKIFCGKKGFFDMNVGNWEYLFEVKLWLLNFSNFRNEKKSVWVFILFIDFY
jgi:hypothetical protein